MIAAPSHYIHPKINKNRHRLLVLSTSTYIAEPLLSVVILILVWARWADSWRFRWWKTRCQFEHTTSRWSDFARDHTWSKYITPESLLSKAGNRFPCRSEYVNLIWHVNIQSTDPRRLPVAWNVNECFLFFT